MSKIEFIRQEFLRIGCPAPADVLAYRLSVHWSFRDITIQGKRIFSIDYDMLVVLLNEIPSDVGEDFFWQVVDDTDLNLLADHVNNLMLIEFNS